MADPIALPAECCATCTFYLMAIARCRRYPPQIIVTGRRDKNNVNYQSAFPPMTPDGWCGEFKKAEA